MWIRQGRQTFRMGPADASVVDSELCVHGDEGLRVADASVMPPRHPREHQRPGPHERCPCR